MMAQYMNHMALNLCDLEVVGSGLTKHLAVMLSKLLNPHCSNEHDFDKPQGFYPQLKTNEFSLHRKKKKNLTLYTVRLLIKTTQNQDNSSIENLICQS